MHYLNKKSFNTKHKYYVIFSCHRITKKVISNIFGEAVKDHFYGSEAVLIPNDKLVRFKTNDKGTPSEVIDLHESVKNESTLLIGHIYGGIEALIKNPGKKDKTVSKSKASNKIWEVTISLNS